MFGKNRHKQLFILGCSISVLYLIFIIVFDANVLARNLSGDGGSYLSAMHDLQLGKLNTIRPPGYPAFLLLLNYIPSLTEHQFYISIFIVQFLLWIISFKMLLTFLPDKKHWAWVSLILLIIINPSFVQYSNMILTESLFLFLVLVGFVLLRKFIETKRDFGLYGFLLCMLIATLVRPGLFYFSLLAIVLSLVFLVKSKRFLSTIVVTLGALFLLGVPMRIMKNTYGNHTISYIDKITQYRYLNVQCQSLDRNEALTETMKWRDAEFNTQKENLPELTRMADDETYFFLTSKPALFIKAFANNLYLNFHAGNEYLPTEIPIMGRHFYGLSRMLNMLFVLLMLVCVGFFVLRLILSKNKSAYIFPAILLFYCFYCWFTSGVSFFQGDRFNIVWMPVLVIFIFQFYNASISKPSRNEK